MYRGLACLVFALCSLCGIQQLAQAKSHTFIGFRLSAGNHNHPRPRLDPVDGHLWQSFSSIYASETSDKIGTRLAGPNGEFVFVSEKVLPHNLDAAAQAELILEAPDSTRPTAVCWSLQSDSTYFQKPLALNGPDGKVLTWVIMSTDGLVFVRTNFICPHTSPPK